MQEEGTFGQNKTTRWWRCCIDGYEGRHDITSSNWHVVRRYGAKAVALHDLAGRVGRASDVYALDQFSARLFADPEQQRYHETLRLIQSNDNSVFKLGISGCKKRGMRR